MDGACVFQEIDERYVVLRKQYLKGFFFGNDVYPVYLYDKVKKKVVDKGDIHFGISTTDLEIVETKTHIEYYYRSNDNYSIFFYELPPSIRNPWKVKKNSQP